jgi:hypothetical protein
VQCSHQQRDEGVPVDGVPRGDLRPCKIEEGREQIHQRVEGEDLDSLGDARAGDDKWHAGGCLERHHLVELLVFHLHVAVVGGADDDCGVDHASVLHRLDVRADHVVILGDHRVVPGADGTLVGVGVLSRPGLCWVVGRQSAALLHRGLLVARVNGAARV